MARFEVIDPRDGPAPPGPWETRAAPATSFALGEAVAPLWRVSLPADAVAAAAELAEAEGELARQAAAVAAAPVRLRALAVRGGAASFGATAGPEARLQGLIGASAGRAGASLSTGGDGQGELQAAQERFGAFVQQVQDAVGNLAVVETRLEGRLVARSSVSWTGDLRALLGAGLAVAELELHRRSLGLATATRVALLRMFAVVMRGAAIVAVMASSPAGVVYALPAAWRFVDDILQEVRGP